MGTHASVRISDEHGNTAGVAIGSDGHLVGPVLIDCAEHWKVKVNDDDQVPPAGTPAEFAAALCGPYYGRSHNGEPVEAVPARAEFNYEVALAGGVVTTITAYRRSYDGVGGQFLELLRAGQDPTVVGVYRRRFLVRVDPVEVCPPGS